MIDEIHAYWLEIVAALGWACAVAVGWTCIASRKPLRRRKARKLLKGIRGG